MIGFIYILMGSWVVSASEQEVAPTCSGVNRAFLFVKPNAVTPQAVSLVRERLTSFSIAVVNEGVIDAATIDQDMLIDNHYGAIASKAVKLKPHELNVSPEAAGKFKSAFSEDFEAALADRKVLNAKEACARLGLTTQSLGDLWSNAKIVKFGGGFYCGRIAASNRGSQEDEYVYVINGFYMAMRSMYVEPSASIRWMCLEWPESDLSWEEFRRSVIGSTDPFVAEPSSIRRTLLDDWSALGLANQPSMKENGVHASASSFEALSERMNWLSLKSAKEDPFGEEIIAALREIHSLEDEAENIVEQWRSDPSSKAAKDSGLFDHLEDRGASDCLLQLMKEF